MPGSTDLVSTGFGSRGFVLETRLFDGRIEIAAGNIFGNGIIGTQRGFEAYDSENRRSAVDMRAEVLQWEEVSLTVRGTVLDVRRPGNAGFNVGEVPDAEENSVLGLGLDLGLFDDRLVYVGDFGWSTYNNPDDFAVGDGGVGDTGDKAETHRIDASLWDDGDIFVDAFGEYSIVNPLYRSVEAFATADRETFEYGGSAGWRMVSISASYNEFDNNVNNINSILTTRQATSAGDLSIDLEEFRYVEDEDEDGFAAIRLLPSSVFFNASRSKVKALNADEVIVNSSINGSEIPNQIVTSFGLGFSWDWEIGSTSISLSRSQLDTRQAGRDTADTDDKSFDISQSVFGDIWDASGRFAVIGTRNKEITSQSTDTRFEGGVSFSIRPEDLPNFFASFDASFLETQFDVARTTSLTNSWRLNTSLDFTKYMPEAIVDYQPYAKVNYQIGDTDTRDPIFGLTSNYDYAVTLAVGFQF